MVMIMRLLSFFLGLVVGEPRTDNVDGLERHILRSSL